MSELDDLADATSSRHVPARPTRVIVQRPRGNGAALGLGIAGLVLGILALTVAWIPILGIYAIPVAVIGGVLAGVGVLISLITGGRSIGMPIAGLITCATAIAIVVLVTGAVIRQWNEEQRKDLERLKASTPGPANEEGEEIDSEASKPTQEEMKAEQLAANGDIRAALSVLKDTIELQPQSQRVSFWTKRAEEWEAQIKKENDDATDLANRASANARDV